jgi:hypothetical protein
MHQNLPAAGAGQTGQNADQCSFDCAVGAQQTKEFTFFHVNTDTVKRLQ